MPRSSSAAKVEEWTKRLERFAVSSSTAAKFCEAEGVSLPSFYPWKQKLTARSNSATKSTQRTSAFAAIEWKPTTPVSTIIRLPYGILIEWGGDTRGLRKWIQPLLDRALDSASWWSG